MTDTEKKTDDTDAPEEERRFETEIETVGPCKVEVRITVPVATIQEEFDNRYREIIKTVQFPGFRIGHAPRRLVEKKLGDEVTSDVKEHLITESFKEAIDTHSLEPISEPDVDLTDVDIEPDKPIQYKAVLIVRPTVEIPDLTKLEVEPVQPEVTAEMVDAALENLRKQEAVLEPVNGPMAENDVAMVDVTAAVEDEKILDEENAQYTHPAPFLRGLKIDALKDDILGKSAGDEFTITEKLPDTWPKEEHAGKDMVVEITVQEVKRYALPELDDAFAEKLDYDDLAELREEVEDGVKRQAEQAAREATNTKIVDALIEASPFELPEDVVKEETGRRIERKRALLRMQGVGEEEMEEKIAEASSAERADVEREFRSGFLLDAIAKKEKVLVTESEVDERVAQMAAAYHRSVEEMQEYLDQRDMMGSIRANMREEKVIDLLRKRLKIED